MCWSRHALGVWIVLALTGVTVVGVSLLRGTDRRRAFEITVISIATSTFNHVGLAVTELPSSWRQALVVGGP